MTSINVYYQLGLFIICSVTFDCDGLFAESMWILWDKGVIA